MSHRVVSAYATLRVPNDLGQEVLVGFYENAILPAGVNRDDLDRHVRKGMVVKESATEPERKPAPASQPPGVPNGRSSREDWAAYATTKGAPAEETKAVDEGGLSRDDLRAKYGS
ncbi:hypothetical protein [Micromonospora tarensis]|uniref:Lsr2 protein n=1 Tax=Micromonospora tarensis TaxID=2806100 RepID=A0ABS1YKZ8_9ACTN|nr:hypothetical protein [Micromonospora tarensis]MBM0277816.1 hypothetical protein [Micromonospora tarensis]